MLPAARLPRTLLALLVAAFALLLFAGAGSSGDLPAHGAFGAAPPAQDVLPGAPTCPTGVGEIVLVEEELRLAVDRDTWQDWIIKCRYRSADDPGDGQPRIVDLVLQPYGSMSVNIRFSVGQRHTSCDDRSGVSERGTSEGSYSTGATYMTGSGEVVSATHQLRATWGFVIIEGVNAANSEALALPMIAAVEAIATPCEPEPSETFSPASCPAVVGNRVLYEGESTLDPEQQSLDNGASWEEVRCVYRFAYAEDGDLSDDVTARAGWTDVPVDPNDGRQREGQSCTEFRVRFDLGAPVIVTSDTHVARVTVRGDGTEAEMQGLADTVLANLEGIAATCPLPAVDEGARPAPGATETETASTESCAPSGHVLDGAGRPVVGIRIELRYQGAVRQTAATDATGRWSMVTIGTTSGGATFDPNLDPVELLLVAKDDEHDPRWFELRYGAAGDIPHLRFGPLLMEDLTADPLNCAVDFDLLTLDASDPLYEAFVGPDSLDHWDDLLEFYTNMRNVWIFGTETLGVTMDSGLPLPIYTFCTAETPGTKGQCSRGDGRGAFWNGRRRSPTRSPSH